MNDWKVGDVIARAPNGPWRIIRSVTHGIRGQLLYVTLAIRHCSWTGRAYTVINHSALRQLGYRRVARNAKMRSKLDRQLRQAITQRACEPKCMTCHDVKGIA